MSVSISYAILACNEHLELTTLLNSISQAFELRRKDGQEVNDEVVIVLDESNYTTKVENVVKSAKMWEGDARLNLSYYFHPLNQDFARQKNFLNSKCTREWIFNIDADENLGLVLLSNVNKIVETNPQVEAYWLPRVNKVRGLTQEDIHRYRWHINHKGWINWPDWQLRLYKNKSDIKWTKPVHEQLVGYEYFAKFPEVEELAIRHPKDIKRQRKQNEFYNSIVQ